MKVESAERIARAIETEIWRPNCAPNVESAEESPERLKPLHICRPAHHLSRHRGIGRRIARAVKLDPGPVHSLNIWVESAERIARAIETEINPGQVIRGSGSGIGRRIARAIETDITAGLSLTSVESAEESPERLKLDLR